ncbi:TonB-linked outer membrane protein, SusC/RagA family [Prevotella sp. KH2C16]|nr:TonB-linked outer membrane protein, SusC/RagA family [Prevotella sp. KH2C16]
MNLIMNRTQTRKWRLMALAILCLCSLAAGAQTITKSFKDATLKSVLEEIERQTKYSIAYEAEEVNVNKRITDEFEATPLRRVLERVLDKDLTFDIKNRMIAIKRAHSPRQTQQRPVGTQKRITGRVVDEKGDPLVGAVIKLKGEDANAVTDIDGNFSLLASSGSELEISYLGYLTQTISVKDRENFKVVLKENVNQLDEVVAIGYGTQKKVTLTGSTATTSGKILESNSSVNLSQGLAGRLPGVIVNNRSGEPGNDDAIMYIRGRSTLGDNKPLIVIDGVAGRGDEFGRLSGDEIESVTVLKDASAAIYGSRSANGVILVTTKRGQKSAKPTIIFSYDLGMQQPTRLPKMANAVEFTKAVNADQAIEGDPQSYTDEMIQKYADGSDPVMYPNTDWYDEVIKPLSLQHKYGVTAQGGTEMFTYFASLNGQYQDGIYRKSATNYTQYNMRTNLDFNVTDWLSIGFDMSAREQNKHYSAFPSDQSGIFWVTYRAKPTSAAYFPDGRLRGGLNPAVMVQNLTGYDRTKIHTLNTTLTARINLDKWIKGLSLEGHLAYDKTNSYEKNWKTPWNYWSYDEVSGEYTERTSTYWPSPSLDEYYRGWHSLTLNGQINYDRIFAKDHHVSFMFGGEQNQYRIDRFSAGRSSFGSDALDQLFAGTADHNYWSNTGNAAETARRSFFGRINYDYMSKYMLSFIFRWDGSENFAKGNRWGFFPGISAGWRISEEPFVKKAWGSWLTNLKLRASYGEQGNDNISAFQYLTTYSYTTSTNYLYNYITQFGGADANIIIPGIVGNPNVTWEVAKTWNIGLDGNIKNGLFSWELEFFHTRRSNILVQRNASVPAYTGLTSLPDENIGIVTNGGFELQLSHQKHVNRDFMYSIAANFLYAKNKIKFMDETPWGEGHEYLQQTGHPMGSSLYYHAIGIYRTEEDLKNYPSYSGATLGQLIYEDIDGDDKITTYDRQRSDLTTIPQVVFGVTFNAQWKNFDFMMLLQGQARAKFYYEPLIDYNFSNIDRDAALKAWTLDRTDAEWPRIGIRYGATDFWHKDASFLRLKNLEIGYTFPKPWLASVGITNVRIYIGGYNLLTFDKLKYVDPENSDVNIQTYPQTRIYNAGIKVTF